LISWDFIKKSCIAICTKEDTAPGTVYLLPYSFFIFLKTLCINALKSNDANVALKT